MPYWKCTFIFDSILEVHFFLCILLYFYFECSTFTSNKFFLPGCIIKYDYYEVIIHPCFPHWEFNTTFPPQVITSSLQFVSRDSHGECLMTMAGKPTKAGKSSMVNTRQGALLQENAPLTIKWNDKSNTIKRGKEFNHAFFPQFVPSFSQNLSARIKQAGWARRCYGFK